MLQFYTTLLCIHGSHTVHTITLLSVASLQKSNMHQKIRLGLVATGIVVPKIRACVRSERTSSNLHWIKMSQSVCFFRFSLLNILDIVFHLQK
jgi:hypothetical protein